MRFLVAENNQELPTFLCSGTEAPRNRTGEKGTGKMQNMEYRHQASAHDSEGRKAFGIPMDAGLAPLPATGAEAHRRSVARVGLPTEMTPDEERLMIEHLPTVRYLARRIHERLPQHVEMDDLVSAGVLGLIDALHKFDPEKKIQFRSYAQFRIRGAILDSLRTLDWSPRNLRRKGRAIEEAIRALTARTGRVPSEFEIAAELGMELSEYQQLLGELRGLELGTLHVEHSEDSSEEELAYIPNKPHDDPLFCCLKNEMQARLASAIDQLSERERLVMTLYYYEEMTMKEISLTLGVVESRVSQIHTSAVLHLRSFLASLSPQNLGSPRPGPKRPTSS
jgi:RNA polymerase sigma factor FliA